MCLLRCQSERDRLFYHLSNVFPSSSVKTVMESNPDIQDPRKLCESILQLHRGFESPLKSPSNEPPKWYSFISYSKVINET